MSTRIPDPSAPRFSRRTGLRLAAAGATGMAAAVGAAGTAMADDAPTPPDGDPSADPGEARAPTSGETAYVAVTATTLWVDPGTNRSGIDDPAVSMPVDLDAWNDNMPDTETRQWLTGKLESQAVLGSRVIVDEIDGDWAHVAVTAQPTPRDERGYPGWVPVSHLVVDHFFDALSRTAATATVTALTTELTGTLPGHDEDRIPLSFDTVLPVIGTSPDIVRVAVPGALPGRVPEQDVVVRGYGEEPPLPTVEDVIATGERFLGLRYLWAGVSAYGFDCSGYTYTLLHHHGITLNRDAGDQMHHSGLEEVEREDLQRGDLVFFATEPGGDSIRHVAVYLGDDMIMQAPNASRSVEIMSLTEYDPDGEYAGARRVDLAR